MKDKSMKYFVVMVCCHCQHIFNLLSPRSYERLLNDEQMPPEEIVLHLKRLYFKSIATVKGE